MLSKTRMKYRNLSCSALFSIILICGLVSKATAKTVEDRVKELEEKIKAIQQTYLANSKDAASAIARAETASRSSTELKGSIETNQHLIEMQAQETQKLFRDLDNRLKTIEERMHVLASQMSKALAKVSPDIAKEGDLYQTGLDKINAGDYLEAAGSFQAFLNKYPKSQFAPMAQYWIGESFFSLRDYKRAIKEFQTMIEKFPRHEKAKAALLNQGSAFYELQLLDEAKTFLNKVIHDYPASVEATEAQAKIERIDQRKAQGTGLPQTNTGSYPTETLEQQRSREQSPPTAPLDPKPNGEKPAEKNTERDRAPPLEF